MVVDKDLVLIALASSILWIVGLPFVAGAVAVSYQWWSPKLPKPKHIAVVGNIGSGKSRIISNANLPDWTLVAEPVLAWSDLLSRELTVAVLYELQTTVTAHFLKLNRQKDQNMLVERDFLSNVVFASSIQPFAALLEEVAANAKIPLPSAVVFVDTEISACLETIAHRQQAGDEHITHEYIAKLHDRHMNLLKVYELAGVPVVFRSAHESDNDAVAAAIKQCRDSGNVTKEHVSQLRAAITSAEAAASP